MGERALNLTDLQPAQDAQGPQARRPRPRLRQGQVRRPRQQGPEVARGLAQDARRLRGRPDADLHAHRQAARLDVEGRDARRPVPHRDGAGEPARPRPVRGRRRRHAGGARREAADQEHEDRREAARHRRDLEEAHRPRARHLGDRPREDRSRGWHRRAAARAQGEEGEAPQGQARRSGSTGGRRAGGRRRCARGVRGHRSGTPEA